VELAAFPEEWTRKKSNSTRGKRRPPDFNHLVPEKKRMISGGALFRNLLKMLVYPSCHADGHSNEGDSLGVLHHHK